MDVPSQTAVQRLVSRIEAEIVHKSIPPGSVLGTESDLCARYGVSATIFRQATRVLEAADVALTRRGNGGGLVVLGYSVVGAAKTVAVYLEFRGAKIADLLPIWSRLFQLGMRLAADRMTLADADRLRALLSHVVDAPVGFERGMRMLELNQQLLAAAGNPILTLVYRVLQQILTDAVSFEFATEAAFDQAQAQTAELLNAVIDCDRERIAGLAERAMSISRQNVESAIASGAPKGRARLAEAEDLMRNLSDQVAHRMLQEIRQMGWPVGARLGSEPDLMTRYGVSRATLRQAVRQLEQHFAVRSRRGPGGGIFVAEPREPRVFDVSAQALRLAQVSWVDVVDVVPDLVGLALDLSLARADGGAILATGLQAARLAPTTAAALRRTWLALGEACANSVTAIVLEIIGRLGVGPGLAESENADAVWRLLAAAGKSLEAGDQSRLKRALLDLANTYGFGDEAAVARQVSKDRRLAS